jgi:hypothetical protein
MVPSSLLRDQYFDGPEVYGLNISGPRNHEKASEENNFRGLCIAGGSDAM